MLRSQLELFFSAPVVCPSSDEKPRGYDDFDDVDREMQAESSAMARNKGKVGFDSEGRRGGVWVRKPRSSRKGSGGESTGQANWNQQTRIIHRLS